MIAIERYLSNDTIVEFFSQDSLHELDNEREDNEVVRSDDLVDFSLLDFD